MLTIKELSKATDKELAHELQQARRSLLKFKMGVKSGQEKAINKIPEFKKYIAQILTVMGQVKKADADKISENSEK